MAGRLDPEPPGRLTLKAGGRFRKLLTIFSNPKLPSIHDYYEPWTYDYATLTDAPAQEHTPVARPKSLLTGQRHQDHVVGELGRRPRRLSGHVQERPGAEEGLDAGQEVASRTRSCSTCRGSASTA